MPTLHDVAAQPKGHRAGIAPFLAALAALIGSASPGGAQTSVSGEFYYSTYGSSNSVGVGTFNWTGSILTASTTTLVTLPGFSIDGSLSIGSDGLIYTGRAGVMYAVDPSTLAILASGTGVNSNVTSVDPSGNTIWAGWKDTPLASHTVGTPMSSWTTRTISGGDSVATGLAWVPNGGGGFTTWYTTGGENVLGNVGTINLSTGVTTQVLTGVSATNITFDPFTGSLFTAGINGIDQINPTTGTIESTWNNPLGSNNYAIQQLAATGTGQLLAFNSDGTLLVWDMTAGSGLIGGPSTIVGSVNTGVLGAGLELIPVPEPAAWILLLAGIGFLWIRYRAGLRPLDTRISS